MNSNEYISFGDVNGDSKVDVSDCVCICMYDAGKIQLTDAQLIAADVDGVAGVTIDDAHFLAEYIAGLRESLN